jgi:hypothetical protein
LTIQFCSALAKLALGATEHSPEEALIRAMEMVRARLALFRRGCSIGDEGGSRAPASATRPIATPSRR